MLDYLRKVSNSIMKSTRFNTGQCLPLTAIAQNSIDYIEKYNLDPEKTVIWNLDSSLSCNIKMFPHYIKHIMNTNGYEKTSVYASNLIFSDISIKAPINVFFGFMFGGLVAKLGCKVRPYEVIKGSVDKAIKEATDLVYDMFEKGGPKLEAAKKVNKIFNGIKTIDETRPKVAIFGDLYVRDNDVMNQDLIRIIEQNGGEVIITPYNEYTRIIGPPYIKKWFKLGKFSNAMQMKILMKIISTLDDKYYKYFKEFIKGPDYRITNYAEKILSEFNLKLYHNGESMENILKIFSLIDQHPDISLFVQTSPSYCCPSLITEAMSERLEEVTGVPIVSITYDGTQGNNNDAVIPYLKFPRKTKNIDLKKAL